MDDMHRATGYISATGSGLGWNIKWNNYGTSDGCRDQAIDFIVNRDTPSIVGTPNHFPMAYGYAYQYRQ